MMLLLTSETWLRFPTVTSSSPPPPSLSLSPPGPPHTPLRSVSGILDLAFLARSISGIVTGAGEGRARPLMIGAGGAVWAVSRQVEGAWMGWHGVGDVLFVFCCVT